MDGYGVAEDQMTGIGLIIYLAQRGNKMAIDSLLENGKMTKEQLRTIYNISL